MQKLLLKAFLVLMLLSGQSYATKVSKSCFDFLDEFVGKRPSSYREISIRVEEGSVAYENNEIREFISEQPSPFWNSDDFATDFFLLYNSRPTVTDAFDSAKEKVKQLAHKVDTLNRKYPEHGFYFNAFRSHLSQLIKHANINFNKKFGAGAKDAYSFDLHYNMISSTLLNGALGALAEMKVALARKNILAQSFFPFLKKGNIHQNIDELSEVMSARMDLAAKIFLKNVEMGSMDVRRMRQMYPILSSSITAHEPRQFVEDLVAKIQGKEFDLLTYDKELDLYTFIEVKHSEKIVGHSKQARDSIIRQAKMTYEILSFIGIQDKVAVELAAPFGLDVKLNKRLKELGVQTDGAPHI